MSTTIGQRTNPPYVAHTGAWAVLHSEETIGEADDSALLEACKELARHAQTGLSEDEKQALVPSLLALLQHTNYKVAAAAISALVAHEIAQDDVIVALRKTASSGSLVLQWKAINALGRLGIVNEDILDALVDRLQDDNHNIRRASIKALGQLAQIDQRAGLALIEHMQENEIDLFRLIRPMLEGVHVTNVTIFFRLIHQANSDLKSELLSWLGKHADMSDPEQVAQLLDFLEELLEDGHDKVKREVCRQLRGLQYDGHDISQLIPALIDTLEGAQNDELCSQALWTLKTQALSAAQCATILRKAQKGNDETHIEYALQCAERLRDDAFTAELVQLLCEQLSHEHDPIRLHTLTVLKRQLKTHPELSQKFVSMLCGETRDTNIEVRCKVIDILDGFGEDSPEYVAGLEYSIKEGPIAEVRLALLAVGNLSEACELLDVVLNCLRHYCDEGIVENGILALAHMGPGIAAQLLHALDDADETYREVAELALEGLGADALNALLVGLQNKGLEYNADTGLSYRIDCAYTCARLASMLPHEHEPLLQALQAGLQDQNPWVRRYCAEALGLLKAVPVEVADALAPLLDDPSWDVRAAAAEALASPSFDDVIVPLAPRLIELLSAPEDDVRSAAVIALDGCIDKAPSANAALLDVATNDPTWYIRRLAAEILS